MTLFWVFIIIATLTAGIVFLPRRGYLLWAYNLLLILVVTYFGLYRIAGSPRSVCMISALTHLRGDYEVLWSDVQPQDSIYLLIRSADATPVYLQTRWSPLLYQELQTATMNAERDGSVVMVRADELSKCTPEPMQNSEPGNGRQQQRPGKDGQQNAGPKGPKHGTEGGEPMFYAKPVETPPEKLPPQQENIELH